MLVSSEVESELYECRAVGFPSPLDVTFLEGGNALTDGMDGVEVRVFMDGGETVGVLRLRGDFQFVMCMAGNSDLMLTNDTFQPLPPINGMQLLRWDNSAHWF